MIKRIWLRPEQTEQARLVCKDLPAGKREYTHKVNVPKA